MTARTRRRVVICALAVSLTLPVETVLLRAISTPDTTQAVQTWASSLSAESLNQAADSIQAYPFAYRRAIVRTLSDTRRSDVWRRHILRYRDAHPELPGLAVELLDAAAALVTPGFVSHPTPDERARAKAIGDQLVTVIGREAAEHVLYRLGPRDGRFASLEPWSERAANWVRRAMIALALNEEGCDCSTEWGCGGGQTCRSGSGCQPDDDWPACGWLWSQTCDGVCRTIMN